MSKLEDVIEDTIMAIMSGEYPPELVTVKVRGMAVEVFQLGRMYGTSESWQEYTETHGGMGESDAARAQRQVEQTIPIVLGEAQKKIKIRS